MKVSDCTSADWARVLTLLDPQLNAGLVEDVLVGASELAHCVIVLKVNQADVACLFLVILWAWLEISSLQGLLNEVDVLLAQVLASLSLQPNYNYYKEWC